jgi:hypothetical protein
LEDGSLDMELVSPSSKGVVSRGSPLASARTRSQRPSFSLLSAISNVFSTSSVPATAEIKPSVSHKEREAANANMHDAMNTLSKLAECELQDAQGTLELLSSKSLTLSCSTESKNSFSPPRPAFTPHDGNADTATVENTARTA